MRRREFLAGGLALSALAPLAGALAQGAPNLGPDRIVLLGNKGGASIRGYSPSPSCSLIVWKGAPYLVDAGYGVTFKLIEAGFPLAALRYLFITHHHSDHNLDVGPLLYNAWAAGLRTQVDVYGPAGVDALLNGAWAANKADIEARMAAEGRPDVRKLVRSHAFGEGELMRTGDVVVSTLRNKHPPMTESFAFKFQLGGKTVVFSGDTTYFPPLADFARGADYLIHEAAFEPALEALAQRNPNAEALVRQLKASHTMADDVGRIAKAAGVKTLVLNHFVPGDDPSLTAEAWIQAVRREFDGPVIVGRDLMSIPLG